MAIRKFTGSDLQAVKDITAICFDGVCIDQNIEEMYGMIDGKSWQWRKVRHIDEDVAANADGIFVDEIDGLVIGYITTRIDDVTKIGGIPNIGVLPEYRGQKIGHKLMQTALDYFRDEGMTYAKIETLDQNDIGSVFYPKTGFKEVARQIHYAMPLNDSDP